MASKEIPRWLLARVPPSGQFFSLNFLRVTLADLTYLSAVIPIAAYAFVGIEIISAAAIEVKKPQNNLPTPANYIAPVVGLIYILLLLMFCLNIHWEDPGLPPFYGISSAHRQNALQRKDPNAVPASIPATPSVMVLAVQHAGMKKLAGFLMGALIFAAYNTAMTALYVASRTLHGLTRGMDYNSEFRVKRWIAYLGVTNGQRVPSVALVASAIAFGSWLPALHFARARPTIGDVDFP